MLGAFAAALVLGALFVRRQLRTRDPLLDLGLFTRPPFSLGSLAVSSAFFALFGLIFPMTPYLQFVQGRSALETGLVMLPLAFGLVIGSGLSYKINLKLGSPTQMRYRRFLGFKKRLSARDLETLTAVDHHGHEALVALDAETEEPMGVARMMQERTRPDTAEASVAVADSPAGPWFGRRAPRAPGRQGARGGRAALHRRAPDTQPGDAAPVRARWVRAGRIPLRGTASNSRSSCHSTPTRPARRSALEPRARCTD